MLMSSSAEVKITTRPVCTAEHLFTGRNREHIEANMLSRSFDASRFEHITSLLVDESVNRITTTIDIHEDFMILTTRRLKGKEITIGSSLLESITQHHTVLDDVEMDGVESVLLRDVLSKGGHGLFADVVSIEGHGGNAAPCVPPVRLSQVCGAWAHRKL